MKESDQLTLRETFHRIARLLPYNEVAVDEENRYTYRELMDQAQRCAALYHNLGVRKGDRIAFMLYPSTVHCIALFGAIELGAIPVALHIRETPRTLSSILHKCSPRVLVYDSSLEENAHKLLQLCPYMTGTIRATSSIPEKLHAGASPSAEIPGDLSNYVLDFEPVPVYESDPAAIVLSSGTTGIPKGIVHTNRSFMNGARGAVYNFYGIRPSDALLNVFTTSFIAWYNPSLPFFNVGAKIVFRTKWEPLEYLRTIQEEKITLAMLAPTMWRMLFSCWGKNGEYDTSSVRVAAFSGEVMDMNTLKLIKKNICSRVVNIYGTTELGASSGTVMFEDEMTGGLLASVGKSMLNSDIRVVRPGGTKHDEVPAGEKGEVLVQGTSVADQVWDDIVMTRKIFESDGPNVWWHSGDMGYKDEEGYLFLEGRVDDMIISGGINIMPASVEEALLAHPDVQEVAVVGEKDAEWGQKVKAYVVSARTDMKAQELDVFLKNSDLSDYKRPRMYEFIESLPRTATGKIDRKALRSAKNPE